MIISNTPVFNIQKVGTYPREKYVYTPKSFTTDIPEYFTISPGGTMLWSNLDGTGRNLGSGASLVTNFYLNYHKNPLNQVLDYSDAAYSSIISFSPNIRYINRDLSNKFQVITDKNISTKTRYIESPHTINLQNDSSITYNSDVLRTTYKTPYNFCFFYVQLDDATKTCYGFLSYPNIVFLKPISVTNNGGKWQLTTRLSMLTDSNFHLESRQIEVDALNYHNSKLLTQSLNPTEDYPSPTTDYLKFGLSATKMFVDNKIVSWTGGTPTRGETSADLLDYINPDSTFISYDGTFYDSELKKTSPLVQRQKSLVTYFDVQSFSPSYILRYDPVNSVQTFQLLQATLNTNVLFSDTRNCVLSATLDLKNGNFKFINNYPSARVSFANQPYIGFDYISDSPIINSQNVIDTLNSNCVFVNGTSYNITTAAPINDLIGKDIVWETDFPPYYYSYKSTVLDGDTDTGTYLDSNGLNFYLRSQTFNPNRTQTSNQISLSTAFASDYNYLTIPISPNDSIAYTIIDSYPISVSDLLTSIDCYLNDARYVISKPNDPLNFVTVTNGAKLVIDYNNNNSFGGATFTIKATVKTASNQIIDSYESTNINFIPEQLFGNNIALDVITEDSNIIKVDSSFNNSASSWPSRDLTNSDIVWTHSNNNLPISFFYIDNDGNYLAPVSGPTVFGPSTWKVAMSGYGPVQTTITLSSKKYNEIATINTNPNLYNFLSQGTLILGPTVPLNNLPRTRTITLTAAIPYADQIYNIPSNIPINWTWQYDDISDPVLQPIKAKKALKNNDPYQYGINTVCKEISAMSFEIIPAYSDRAPTVHRIKLIANIDVTYPPISGVYNLNLDDFPDPKIFNSDFSVYYKDFFSYAPKYKLVDTRSGKNILTRPNQYTIDFVADSNKDTLPKIKNKTLDWIIDGKSYNINSENYNITLSNSSLSPLTINNYVVSAVNIGLNLVSGLAPGWTSAHSVSSNVQIYLLNPDDYNLPLKFIIYPEYAWLSPDTEHLQILDETNFTQSYRPSAYFNKKSNSQTWWVSANKNCFDDYLYQNQDNNIIISASSNYSLIDIPYNYDSISNLVGLPVTLFAYNTSFYPENNDLIGFIQMPTDIAILSGTVLETNGDYSIITQSLNVTAKTFRGDPSNNTPPANVYDNFFLSPVMLQYDDVLTKSKYYKVSGNTFQEIGDYLLLDDYPQIYSTLDIETIPSGRPAKVISGTVNYYLSTKYWTASSVIDINNFTNFIEVDNVKYYNIFNLEYGDPAVPLNCGKDGTLPMFIYYTVFLKQQIPPTTFENVKSIPYPDLWDIIEISNDKI